MSTYLFGKGYNLLQFVWVSLKIKSVLGVFLVCLSNGFVKILFN